MRRPTMQERRASIRECEQVEDDGRVCCGVDYFCDWCSGPDAGLDREADPLEYDRGPFGKSAALFAPATVSE
jgi:hypothetical protein